MAASTAEPPPERTSRATIVARGSSVAAAPAKPSTLPLPIVIGPIPELPPPQPGVPERARIKRKSCGREMKDLALPANPSKHDMRKATHLPNWPKAAVSRHADRLAARETSIPCLGHATVPGRQTRPAAVTRGAAIFRECNSLAIAFRRQIGHVVPESRKAI